MGDEGPQQERNNRSSRIIRAVLVAPDGSEHDLLIRNVSHHGLGAKIATILVRAGDRLVMRLPNIGEVTGTVRWTRGEALGIQTDEAIDIDLLFFRGEDRPIAVKADGYRTPRSFEPDTDPRRPGFGRWRRGDA